MSYVSLDKHGVPSDGYLELVQYIREECEHLSFAGLMTIGRINHQHQINGPNPDFMVRTSLEKTVKREFPHQLECHLVLSDSMYTTSYLALLTTF